MNSNEKKIIKKVAREMIKDLYMITKILSCTVKFDEEHDCVEFIYVRETGIDRYVFDYVFETCTIYHYLADTCIKQSCDHIFKDFINKTNMIREEVLS